MRFTSLLAVLALIGCAGAPPIRIDELPLLPACSGPTTSPVGPVDVAVAIDTSASTRAPSGSDINRNGLTGEMLHSVMTDPHDSVLSAEVAAVRSLLYLLAGSDTRLSIVAFDGRIHQREYAEQEPVGIVLPDQGFVAAPLAADVATLEQGLDRVLERGSQGATEFSAAMKLALGTLSGSDGRSESSRSGPPVRRVVLMLAQGPDPVRIGSRTVTGTVTLSAGTVTILHGIDPLMKMAAQRAIKRHIRIFTFGLGDAATAKTPHALSRIAGATGGRFTPVPDPTRLHCQLLQALQ